jgi:hypothetical protein
MMTRPGLAEGVSKLSQFLQNPSKKHQSEAFRLIAYSYHYRDHAIVFGDFDHHATDACTAYTDASFGNLPDRRSFQGHIFFVLGSPIFWRASKQPTVTTSTTEAELLSLSAANKELLALERLIHQVGLQLPSDVTHHVRCDNAQTVGIVNKNGLKINTCLRHIDIQQHWLREAQKKGRIKVSWIATQEMIADGLTKAFGSEKQEAFRKALKMVPLSSLKHMKLASKS